MIARSRTTRKHEGFVLVGVVVLVLALTILGLSLFSLSSYEAQFFNKSLDETNAYETAVGAVERAKVVLTATDTLGKVRLGLPDSVIATTAYQWKSGLAGIAGWDSNGAMDPDTVRIRATARWRDAVRTVEGVYRFTTPVDLYKSLITSTGFVEVPDENSSTHKPCRPQTYLTGLIQLPSAADVSWVNDLPASVRPDIRKIEPPSPGLDDYTVGGRLWNIAQNVTRPVNGSITLGAPGQVTYWKSYSQDSNNPDRPTYSVLVNSGDPQLSVTVRGTVVWMFDKGFKSELPVEVHGGPPNLADPPTWAPDCLVMVGKECDEVFNGERFPYGVWFFRHVTTFGGVPLILVSDSDIAIEHVESSSDPSTVSFLSAYGRKIRLMGPGPSNHLALSHPQSAWADSVIDRISDLGVLPNQPHAVHNKLNLVSDTWLESSR